jgi:hypothetical protein
MSTRQPSAQPDEAQASRVNGPNVPGIPVMDGKPTKSDNEETVIKLSRKNAVFILELLVHPPKPKQRLRQALDAFRQAISKQRMPDFAANLKGSPLSARR